MTRLRAWADERGATAAEYTMALGLVALVCIGAWASLGSEVEEKADCAANAIAGGAGAPCTAGAGAGGGAGGGGAARNTSEPAPGQRAAVSRAAAALAAQAARGVGGATEEPSFARVPWTSGASFVPIDGTLYSRGTLDLRSIDANDVSQGNLNDCYVLSPFAAIAQTNPQIISRAIRTNADGSYTVSLYQPRASGGYERVEVVVTNKFPRYDSPTDGTYVFAQPGDTDALGKPELWPMILEKAYAQLQGGYNALRKGGHPSGPLEALTGRRSTRITPADLTFEQIEKYYRDGYAITMGTLVDDDAKHNPLFQDSTLTAWHVYYVSGVDSVHRMITITNPRGWGEDTVTLTFEQFQSATTGVTANPAPRLVVIPRLQ